MMDAKETASKLYTRFYDLAPTRIIAQECALICVEEIVKDAEKNWNIDGKNYEHSNHSKFWLEVKLELLKKIK